MRIRWGEGEDGESASTEIPVELGDSGEATMGSGKVRRLRYVGVPRFLGEDGEVVGLAFDGLTREAAGPLMSFEELSGTED
jgi:hypothetical protein